jgi:hypothetical protein
MWGRHQPGDHFAVPQMLVHNFIDIGRVEVAVPHALRIHDGHWTARTPIHAPRLVHPDLTWPGQARRANPGFAMVKRSLRLMLSATVFTVFTLIEAKKDVALEILKCFSHGQKNFKKK